MSEGFVPFGTSAKYKDLQTKRFDKMMEALRDLKVSHEINITPQVNKVKVKPDLVLRWGIWVLVVVEAARLGLFIYLNFFN